MVLHQIQRTVSLLHIRIPPKCNGVISVSIKGHGIKTPTACFIGSQYTDTEVRLIDGVHDISRNATLQVLVINNSNHHVNFPKGMKIGHLEPPIDDLAQIPSNSATTQRMLPETVKPDSFTPPKYQLDTTTQQQLDFLLRTFKTTEHSTRSQGNLYGQCPRWKIFSHNLTVQNTSPP